MGGGGGGDGGYQEKQDAIEAKKTAARARLNAMFGVAPAVSSLPKSPTIRRPMGEPDEMASTNADTSGIDEAAANKAARDKLYGQVRENYFTAGKRGADEQKTVASRNNKFALFGQGLQGGSVDVDQNALLDRTYKQGLLNLGAQADAAKADMQGSDEQTRLGLLQSIDSGMDEGSALSSALSQMQVNSDRATAQAKGNTVGDLFGTAGLLYQQNNAARGARDAGTWWQNYNRTSQPGARSGPQGGVISKVGV